MLGSLWLKKTRKQGRVLVLTMNYRNKENDLNILTKIINCNLYTVCFDYRAVDSSVGIEVVHCIEFFSSVTPYQEK